MFYVGFDNDAESLFIEGNTFRRRNVTSCRDALNGYQKGKCFYCFTDISITKNEQKPDVDHFLPHKLKDFGMGNIIDGVWNLVLACQNCNRGEGGKSSKMPSKELLERIWKRNEFLINSHHPLRETLIHQTGKVESTRRIFLNTKYNDSLRFLLQTWKHCEVGPAIF
jgi:5-methylcytosine-specific restriction endonuclease McrA